MISACLILGSLPQQFRTGEQHELARGGTPRRSSRRSRSRARPGPRSADCPPVPFLPPCRRCRPASVRAHACRDYARPASTALGRGPTPGGCCAAIARVQRRRVPAGIRPPAAALDPSSPPRRSPRSDVPGPRAKPAPDRGRADAWRSSHRFRRRRCGRDYRAAGPDPALKARQSRFWRDATTSNGAWRSQFVLMTRINVQASPQDKVTSAAMVRKKTT